MIKKFSYILVLITFFNVVAQEQSKAFADGEWLNYKLSYSGFLKAGEAEILIKEKDFEGKKVYHAVGKGRTAHVVSLFFKVRDRYESYFDFETGSPYKFIRKVREGGHRIRRDIEFKDDKAYIKDYLAKKDEVKAAVNVQDMISAFYYLRNYDIASQKKGDEIDINMFFDGSVFPFKLRYLGDEVIDTKFGDVKAHIFRPIVKAGRVFKAQESLTVWVTADKNKIPILVKAELSVGSVRAVLKKYKGLKNPFKTIDD